MVQGAGVRGRASLRVVHKNILDFIDAAQARPIRNININLNTNGIRLATDTRFVAALGQRNGRHGKSINIYLQFDGFNDRTHREIRGRDLREIKQRVLTNSDVIDLVMAQRPDWFREDDFFPVPCCFPTCRSITYLLTQGTPGRPDFGVVPIPRLIQIEARLTVLRMTAADQLAAAGIDVDAVSRYTALATLAVVDGLIGYRMFVLWLTCT